MKKKLYFFYNFYFFSLSKNSEIYVSCFDIRNFLGEIGKENKESYKYEFRKNYQKMERKNEGDRIVLEQKEIVNSIDQKHKVHINPNKKTVFVKINQIESGQLSYLKQNHNIPIDYCFIIPLEVQKKQNIPEIEGKKCASSFIDDAFDLSPQFLKECFNL